MEYKPILQIVPGLQSIAVLGRAAQMIPKPKETFKPKKMFKGFSDIMVGTALIGPTSSAINAL